MKTNRIADRIIDGDELNVMTDATDRVYGRQAECQEERQRD